MATFNSASPPLPMPEVKVVETKTYRAAGNMAASENESSEKGFKMTKPFKIKQPATIINTPKPTVEPDSGTIGDDSADADDQMLTCSALNVLALLVVVAMSLGMITRVKVYQKYTDKQVQNSRLKLLVGWCEREVKEAVLTLEGRYISQKNDFLRLKSSYDKKAETVFQKAEAFKRWSDERDISTNKLVEEFRKQTRRTYDLIAGSWSKLKRFETRRSNMRACSQREKVDIAFLESVIAATHSAMESLFAEATADIQTILGSTRAPKLKKDLSQTFQIFLEDRDVWTNGNCVEIITHLSSRTRKKLASRNQSKSSIRKSAVDSKSRSSIRSTSLGSSKSSKILKPATTDDDVIKRTGRDRNSTRPARGSSPGGSTRGRTVNVTNAAPKKDSTRLSAAQNTGTRVTNVFGADKNSVTSPRRRCRSLEERSTRFSCYEDDQSNCQETGAEFKEVGTNLVKRLDDRSKSFEEIVAVYGRRHQGQNKSTSAKDLKMPFLCTAKPTDNLQVSARTHLLTRKPHHTASTPHCERHGYPGLKTSFVSSVVNTLTKRGELNQSMRGQDQSNNAQVSEVKNHFYRTNKLSIDKSQNVPTKRVDTDSSPRREGRISLDERAAITSQVRGERTRSAEDRGGGGGAKENTIGRSVSGGVGAGGRLVDDRTRADVALEKKVMFLDPRSQEGTSRVFSHTPITSTGTNDRDCPREDEVEEAVDDGITVDEWHSIFYDDQSMFSSEDECPLNSSGIQSFTQPGYKTEFNRNGNNRPTNQGGATTNKTPPPRKKNLETSEANAVPLHTSRPYFDFSSTKSCGANNYFPSKSRGHDHHRSRSVSTSWPEDVDAGLDSTRPLEDVIVDSRQKTRPSSLNFRPRVDSLPRSRSYEVNPVRRQRSKLSSKSTEDESKLLDSSDPLTMKSLFGDPIRSSTGNPFRALKIETTRQRKPFETRNVQPNKHHGIIARGMVKTPGSPRKPTDLQLRQKSQTLTRSDCVNDKNTEVSCRKANLEAQAKYNTNQQNTSKCLKQQRSAFNRETGGVRTAPQQLKRGNSTLSSPRSQKSGRNVHSTRDNAQVNARVTDSHVAEDVEAEVDNDLQPIDVKLRRDSNIHCSLCPKTDHSGKRPPFR